ncbi:hypothetical protein KTR9_4828 (plasmid) [Gordonia sp. KTR9]|nr:hypothetical protein KTR9_4828 [Gordonia sp. KTR9]
MSDPVGSSAERCSPATTSANTSPGTSPGRWPSSRHGGRSKDAHHEVPNPSIGSSSHRIRNVDLTAVSLPR